MKKVEVSGYDGSSVKLKVRGDIKKWKKGKCWAFYCNNQFYYIKISQYGIASHAYCPHGYSHWKEMLPQKGQKIVHINSGKLIVDKEKK